MATIDTVGSIIPKFASGIGKVTDFIGSTVGKFLSIGNIVFFLLIIGLLYGLYKLWRIDVQNKQYFKSRKREI